MHNRNPERFLIDGKPTEAIAIEWDWCVFLGREVALVRLSVNDKPRWAIPVQEVTHGE